MSHPPLGGALRSHRRQCGLTQAELAKRAGVSRQLVAAVERGRHTPAVDAAIRLAAALRTTTEELFAPAAPPVVAALADRLPERVPLRLARVGDQLVGAPIADHGVAGGGWATADGIWEAGGLRLFAGARTEHLMVAGCEPAFGIAEQMLSGLGSQGLAAVTAPTGQARSALARHRVHGAVVHGPDGRLPRPPVAVRRTHVARWQVGLALPARIRGSLETVLAATAPVVQREDAAAAQQAFVRARQARGLSSAVAGPRAQGHLEAARLGASLRCAAVTHEAAAHTFGLRFLGFEEHVVELWLSAAGLAHPAAPALQELLTARGFTERVAHYGGYDLTRCGAIVRS